MSALSTSFTTARSAASVAPCADGAATITNGWLPGSSRTMPGVGVDRLQRERGDELLDALVLPRDARHGFVGEEMAPELVGQRGGLGRVALGGGFRVLAQHGPLGGVELLAGEPEPPARSISVASKRVVSTGSCPAMPAAATNAS